MNKEVVTIGVAVLAGAITRGATGMLLDTAENTTKIGVNLAGCVGFGYLATKVNGSDTKAAALRGGAIGSAIAHGLLFIGNVVKTDSISAKLATDSKVNTFFKKAAGLNSSSEGLQGYIDQQGNYYEDGLNGYIDQQGNYYEDGLNGYIDASGNFIEDGLNADPELIGYEAYQEENEGLQAAIDMSGNIIM